MARLRGFPDRLIRDCCQLQLFQDFLGKLDSFAPAASPDGLAEADESLWACLPGALTADFASRRGDSLWTFHLAGSAGLFDFDWLRGAASADTPHTSDWTAEQLRSFGRTSVSQARVLAGFRELFDLGDQDPAPNAEVDSIARMFALYYRFRVKQKFQSVGAFREAKQATKARLDARLDRLALLLALCVARSALLLMFDAEALSGGTD